MLAEVAHALLEVTLQVILEFVCYFAGRVVVAVFTLGRVRCETFDEESPWSGRWRIFGRDADGFFLTPGATSFVGFVAITAVVFCIFYCRQ